MSWSGLFVPVILMRISWRSALCGIPRPPSGGPVAAVHQIVT